MRNPGLRRRVTAGRRCLLAVAGAAGWLTLGAWLAPMPLCAEEGERVVQLDVSGNKTVAKETVLAHVETKPGSPYQASVVSEDIRRLFGLGYFTDVRADVAPVEGGMRLTFVVKEKPTASAITVEGNRFLKGQKLLELFGISKGDMVDPRKLKEGIAQVKAEYARKGFAQADAVTRVETNERENTAQVYVLVDEGPQTRISRVLVEGNQAFPDNRLRKVMKTKRRGWWGTGVYSEQVLDEDVERLRAFYQQHGYQDVTVSHAVYRDPTGRGLVAHVTIDEGPQHHVGQIRLTGVVLFPEQEVLQRLLLTPGSVYNPERLRDDLRAIKQYYGDRGYIHAEVTPDPQWDKATGHVTLMYHVNEDERYYVNRVDIQGNLRTKDTVIRRELRIHPGEPFDGGNIRRSIDRLYNLGYFEEVEVETDPTDRPKREDLVVQVKEAKTGSFSFGGGFSSVDRLVGLVELEQRNFDLLGWPHLTGAGQDVRFRVEIGTVRRYFDLSFTEPWMLGHPFSFGVDAFNRTRLRSSTLGLGFEEERRGGGIRLGKEFTDRLRGGVSYQWFRTEISDVIEVASTDLKAEQGSSDVSVGGLSFTYDARDNRFDPSKGYYVFSSADLAGGMFLADRDFYRVEAGASGYWSHAGRFVFESRVRGGIVNEYGDTAEVPIFERFFAGGSTTIRGFRERRVGPRDPFSNDPIGGEATFVGTVEEVLTLVSDEKGRPMVRASVFYDVGNVWRRVGDFGTSFKSGTGVGARVNTPIGPLRLDVGLPISDVGDEKRKPRFHFNISRSF